MKITRLIFVISIVSMLFLAVGCAQQQDTSSYDRFIEELLESGAAVQHMGGMYQPFLSGQGRIARVNGEDIQVFEYANENIARDEVKYFTSDGCCFGNTNISWMGSPHIYQEGRLVVIYVGDRTSTRNLLENMMGPQHAGATYGAYVSNGQRIYFTAESASGKTIVRTGGLFFMHRVACVTCHGEDGEGGRIAMMMWDIDVPNITWEHLTEAEHGNGDEAHPPYDDESLGKAITEGIEPDGEELNDFMPRWQMSDEDLGDLIEYLKTL